MSDPSPDPIPALPQRRTKPTLSDLAPDYPEPRRLQEMLPKEAYIVEGFLGQGGMGAVYHGIQISLNRTVAIKVMQLGIGEQFDYADRFRREAQAMASLNHPNIVAVHDFGMAAGRYLYIVMELVEGTDLSRVLKAGQMTPQIALHLIPQICDALAYAHEHGIIHRDIKPANILLTKQWQVKVADFGLAKRVESNDTLVTRTNMSMGTPDYAAPEQFKDPLLVDHRADIYAVGVTFYQMLTGELPRGAWQPPSVLAKTDPRLDPILIKALMPRREERYQSAREFQQSVIGFTQTLAWEYQQRAQAGPAAAQAGDEGSRPGVAQVPKPRKPEGRLAAPRGKTADKPAEAAPGEKSRKPLLLALGAAAVIAIGALALLSKGEKLGQASGLPESPNATGTVAPPSASPPEQTLTSSAAQSSLATGSGAGTNRGDSQPQAARQGERSEATRETSPPPAMSALPADLQAKLDAVPWQKLDLAGKLESAPQTSGSLAYRNGVLEVRGHFHLIVAKNCRDVAVRVKMASDPEEQATLIGLRSISRGKRLAVARSDISQGKMSLVRDTPREEVEVAPAFPLPMRGNPWVMEAFAIGDSCGAFINGQLSAYAETKEIGHAGTVQITAKHALIESIEYKILDGVPAPVAATGGAADPPATAPLEWQKFDLTAEPRSPYTTTPGTCMLRDGLLEIRDMFALLISREHKDIAVRARLAANPDEGDVKFGMRGISAGKRLVVGRNSSRPGGHFYILDAKDNSRDMLGDFELPARGEPWTLEAFAVGDSFGALVNGNLAAFAETNQAPHAGHAHLTARHALIESIEYLVLDGVPQEQWPAHIREAVETKGKPAPAIAAQSATVPDTPPDDDSGWQTLDLAELRLPDSGIAERLPDGAILLSGAFVFSPLAYEDVDVRVRFRAGTDLQTPKVLARDENGTAYALSNQKLYRYVWSGSAKTRGDQETKGKDLAKVTGTFASPTVQTMELRVRGTQLTGFINGQKVAEATDDLLKSGRVGVYAYRNGIVESIEVRPHLKDRATIQPGELVWQVREPEYSSVYSSISLGPDGSIYAAHSNGSLRALDPRDGSLRWSAKLAGAPPQGSHPLVADDGTVLVAVEGGTLHAFDGADGTEKWTFTFDEAREKFISSPILTAAGRVLLGHRAVYCLDPATGKEIWPAPLPLPHKVAAPPLVAATGQVVVHHGGYGKLVDPATGGILRQLHTGQGSIYAAALADDVVYAATGTQGASAQQNSRIFATQLSTGAQLWEQKIKGPTYTSGMAFDHAGRLFTAGDDQVVALHSTTGQVLWKQHENARPRGFVIGTDGFVYTNLGGDFACLNPEDGSVVWRHSTGRDIFAAPLLTADGLLIGGTSGGYVHALRTASPGPADGPWPMSGQNPRRTHRAPDARPIVLQDSPTDQKLREIEAGIRAEYDAGPGKVFADAAATLRTQYVNALKARAAQSQQAGRLEEVVAFNAEAELFAQEIHTPPADTEQTPSPLKQLRATFRDTLAGHETRRDQAAAPLHAKWDAALDTLQTELTKAGEINEALRVKKLRDQLQQTKALTLPVAGGSDPGRASAPSKPGSLPPATTPTPAPASSRVNERQVAEKILQRGGIIQLEIAGKVGSEIKNAGSLPKGNFSINRAVIGDGSKYSETDLLEIAALPKLKSFGITSNGFQCVTPAVVAALGQRGSLERFVVNGTNLEDADFAPLAGCSRLTHFHIMVSPRFTGAALKQLSGLPLEEIVIGTCQEVTDTNLAALAAFKTLQHVNLASLPQLTPAALDHLPDSLTYLRLNGLSKQFENGLSKLARFARLESLQISDWRSAKATPADARVIAALPALRILYMSAVNEAILNELAANPNWESLTFFFTETEPVKSLAGLAGHKKLRRLSLVSAVTDPLLESLDTLTQIEELNLGGTGGSNMRITDAGMAHVAKLTRLTRLELARGLPITDAGLEPLKALKKLEHLQLTGVPVSPAAVAELKKALPKCQIVGP